eukprot:TRINITY_DN16850_c0_g1_i1.p1 TRINITY_DN16850_c0_g1~~TRINITY_DN16850_c0_g1_i1.p1  ORF type:complete len:215 (+),score=24.24 TRINITY_DN16850_c0_g1_i1:160-804(+)
MNNELDDSGGEYRERLDSKALHAALTKHHHTSILRLCITIAVFQLLASVASAVSILIVVDPVPYVPIFFIMYGCAFLAFVGYGVFRADYQNLWKFLVILLVVMVLAVIFTLILTFMGKLKWISYDESDTPETSIVYIGVPCVVFWSLSETVTIILSVIAIMFCRRLSVIDLIEDPFGAEQISESSELDSELSEPEPRLKADKKQLSLSSSQDLS